MILIDSQPEFIIKFDQDMLQGKSIMQMAKTKKKPTNLNACWVHHRPPLTLRLFLVKVKTQGHRC